MTRQNGEVITIVENDEGNYLCPVCGAAVGANMPYAETFNVDRDGKQISAVYPSPSYENCESCGVWFGIDDDGGIPDSLNDCWARLRKAWLERVPDRAAAMEQLKALGLGAGPGSCA